MNLSTSVWLKGGMSCLLVVIYDVHLPTFITSLFTAIIHKLVFTLVAFTFNTKDASSYILLTRLSLRGDPCQTWWFLWWRTYQRCHWKGCSYHRYAFVTPCFDRNNWPSTSGGTNHELDLQNPDNLGRQSTDAGYVPNLKWSFSDSKTNIFPGGWSREQIISDLPLSTDIAGAQQHLKKGAIRELHWHRTVFDPYSFETVSMKLIA